MTAVKFRLMSKSVKEENGQKVCSVLYSTDIPLKEDETRAKKIIEIFCREKLNGAVITKISDKFVEKKYCFIACGKNIDFDIVKNVEFKTDI